MRAAFRKGGCGTTAPAGRGPAGLESLAESCLAHGIRIPDDAPRLRGNRATLAIAFAFRPAPEPTTAMATKRIHAPEASERALKGAWSCQRSARPQSRAENRASIPARLRHRARRGWSRSSRDRRRTAKSDARGHDRRGPRIHARRRILVRGDRTHLRPAPPDNAVPARSPPRPTS